MRCALVAALVVVAAGCADAGETRVERCVDSLLASVPSESRSGTTEPALRRYAESTYCEPFEQRGWVHDDGALRIDAHEWLEQSGSERCARSDSIGASQPVPCDELRPPEAARVIDCAILRVVRRAEVTAYLERLESDDNVECDDGTPLDELGIP